MLSVKQGSIKYHFLSLWYVIPLLLGDINNSYPHIFTIRFVSHADRKVQDSFDLDVFFFLFLSIRLERGDVTLSATIFYSFFRHIQRSLAHVDLLLSPLPLSTCENNCPSLKSYLYLFRNSGTKFSANWRNKFFYQAENLKFIGTKKIYQFDLSGSWTQNQT